MRADTPVSAHERSAVGSAEQRTERMTHAHESRHPGTAWRKNQLQQAQKQRTERTIRLMRADTQEQPVKDPALQSKQRTERTDKGS
jgi:hypothetical protein